MKRNVKKKTKKRKKLIHYLKKNRVVKFAVKLMIKVMAKRVKCTILYATETGRSERFAKNLCKIFQHAFNARVILFKFLK